MLKKLLFLGIVLSFCVSFIFAQTAIPPSAGDGSENNPYQIQAWQNLYWLSQNSTEWDKHYIQTENINLPLDINTWDNNQGWLPIGTLENAFTGSYNGNNKIIDGLYIERATDRSGFFGYIIEANINNLGLTNVSLICGKYSAGLIGRNSHGTVRNCYTTGSVLGKLNTGGLVGSNLGGIYDSYSSCNVGILDSTQILAINQIGGIAGANTGTVDNCYSSGEINGGQNYTGGLLGYNGGNINYCYSTGNVSGITAVGGLVGYTSGESNISNSYSIGNISGDDHVGGLVGYNSKSTCDINNCYSTGNVVANDRVAGFVGANWGEITNCYSLGSVTSISGVVENELGGFVGFSYQGKFINCYSTGNVHCEGITDSSYINNKGFAGNINTGDDYEMTGAFWDIETSEQTSSAGDAIGKTTIQMKTKSTFTDAAWDFDSTWDMNNTINENYPHLLWQTYVDPQVETSSIEPTSENCALIHFQIIDLGNPDPIQYGVCWSTSSNPTIDNGVTELGEIHSMGSYNSEITDLIKNTVYYVRAYATNAKGTVYGETLSFLNNPNISCIFNNNTAGVIEGGITLIDNNSIYATSSGDGVYKFNEEGTNLYKLNVNGDIKSSTTITHNHMVYIASTDYNLYSFNSNGISNSGWPVSLGAEATASVALDNDNNVYIGTSNGIFQAISPAGTVLWGYNVGAPVNASSVISSSNILYVINENGRIVSFDLNTINPSQVEYEQMYELGESVMSSPALDDEGYMYVTTLEGNLIKLDVDTSSISQMWSYSVGNSIYSSPVIGSDYTIYFGSDGGKAYAINSNGTLKWEKDLEYPVRSTAALAEFGTDNDRLYIGSDGGYLNTLSLINGVFIDKYRTDSDIRCPILYNNNTVYFGTMDGEVIAIPDTVEEISLSKKTNISSQWPTFQGNNRRTGNQIDLNTSVASVPEVFILNQNSPNPWNPTTKIEYRLPSTVNVTLYVFDITGRKVKEWSISNQQAGWHKVIWDGTDMHGNIVSTGVYIYSLRAGNFVDTKKMVFMK